MTTLNVIDYNAKGDGLTDDTAAIQSTIAVANPGDTVVIPKTQSSFMVDATQNINLKSGVTLQIDGVVEAIPNALSNYAIIKIFSCSDVKIIGTGIIKGERDKHLGQTGEWGFGIAIGALKSKLEEDRAINVTIEGVTTKNCWGDGIYIDKATNVLINDILSDSNRRQGCSVIDVDELKIKNSTFENTHGTAPSFGIDLESDNADKSIRNVVIENNKFSGNVGADIGIGGPDGTYQNITVQNNYHEFKVQPIAVVSNPGNLGTPWYAFILNRTLRWLSFYRWWFYPTEYHLK